MLKRLVIEKEKKIKNTYIYWWKLNHQLSLHLTKQHFGLQTYANPPLEASFFRDWNPWITGGKTYDLWKPLKELEISDEVDILANIDDFSAELVLESFLKNEKG